MRNKHYTTKLGHLTYTWLHKHIGGLQVMYNKHGIIKILKYIVY